MNRLWKKFPFGYFLYYNRPTFFGKVFYRAFGIPDIGTRFRSRVIFRLLDSKEKDLILDVGCGEGLYCIHLAQNGYNVIGLDIDEKRLKTASNLKSFTLNTPNFLLCDVQKLPFREDVFDKVICVEVLEHVPEDYSVIHQISIVLKPHGSLVLSVPQKDVVKKRLFLQGATENYEKWIKRHHARFGYNMNELRILLDSFGLKIIKTQYVERCFERFFWELWWLLSNRKQLIILYNLFFPIFYIISRLDSLLFSNSKGNRIILDTLNT